MDKMKSKNSRPPQRTVAPRGRSNRVDRRAQETAKRRKLVAIIGGAVVLVVVAMLAVKLTTGSPATTSDTGPVPAPVLSALSKIPATTFTTVGQGSAHGLPIPVRAPLLRGPNGHPRIIYLGAEYCPYCAAQRWAMIVALNRFGSFQGLHLDRSAADDVYPSTPTFTFYGATYQSNYIDFNPVELQSNQKVNGQYQTLQTPTAEEQQLTTRYNAPPYVPASNAGSIPFVDFANQYIMSGASFSPGILDNHTWQEIASNLNKPSSEQAQAIIGTANQITAAICATTNESPASVCGDPAVKQIEATMAKTPVPKS